MKKLSAVLAIVLAICMLSGCMAIVNDTVINEDGTIVDTVFVGYTEEAILLFSDTGEAEDAEVSLEEIKATSEKYEKDGVTYYGEYEENKYNSIKEYNESLLESSDDRVAGRLVQNDDGSLTYTLILTGNEAEQMVGGSEYDDESMAEMEEMLKEMVMVQTVIFPSAVVQVEGPQDSIQISGNKLTIDVLKVSEKITKETKLVFTTKQLEFVDVAENSWYYAAVMSMARGGLVNGVGNDMFMPDGTLTYAQFCQILAKASGFATGGADGYWATMAIDECIHMGYISTQGEINAENYDVPIPREAAVAAMYRARKDSVKDSVKIEASYIPDYEEISPEYRESVLGAYAAGITTGTDANHTFLPKNTLKRSEVCQLFYNLGWTQAITE